MQNEYMDANEEQDTSVDSSTTEDQQDSIVSEDAQNTESKSDKVKYQEVLAALKAERAKNKALKQQTQVQQPVQTEPTNEDAAYQAFLRTQADAYIAKKLATDPSFRDLAPFIEDKVAQGMDIFAAEREVKAEMFEKIVREGVATEPEVQKTNQLETKATPEQQRPKSSGNILDDVERGNVDGIPPEMADAIKRIRS